MANVPAFLVAEAQTTASTIWEGYLSGVARATGLLKQAYRIRLLRRIILPLLRVWGPEELLVHHHWTGHEIRLNSFKHRSYWFHGRTREQLTIERLQQWIQPGDRVVDAGANIGYFSLIFANRVGDAGHVYAFEPAPDNFRLLRSNVAGAKNVTIYEMALAEEVALRTLFVENLSGLNNSLHADYELFRHNARISGFNPVYETIDVECLSIDHWAATSGVKVDWLKIDVEGAEMDVLLGMKATLQTDRPGLLVEITRLNSEVRDFLTGHGYLLFSPESRLYSSSDLPTGNTFAIHRDAHRHLHVGMA